MRNLQQLAISDEGFIFDPATGESFTVNETGSFIIERLKQNKSLRTIALEMMDTFEVSEQSVERDLNDFADHLRTHKLV